MLDLDSSDLNHFISNDDLKSYVEETLSGIEDDAVWEAKTAKFTPDVYLGLALKVVSETDTEAVISGIVAGDVSINFSASGTAESANKENFSISGKLDAELAVDLTINMIKKDSVWVLDNVKGEYGIYADGLIDLSVPVSDHFDIDDLGDAELFDDDEGLGDLFDSKIQLEVQKVKIDADPLVVYGHLFASMAVSDEDDGELELVVSVTAMNNIAKVIKSSGLKAYMDGDDYAELISIPGYITGVLDDDYAEDVTEEEVPLPPFGNSLVDGFDDLFESLYDSILSLLGPSPEVTQYLNMFEITEDFILSENTYKAVKDKANGTFDYAAGKFAGQKHTVTFIDPETMKASTSQSVEHGKSISETDEVKKLMNPGNGQVFFGWRTVVNEYDGDDWDDYENYDEIYVSLDSVLGDVSVMPVYAVEIKNFDALIDEYYDGVIITDTVDGDDDFDVEILRNLENLRFSVNFTNSDNVGVKEIEWQFKCLDSPYDGKVNTKVDVKSAGDKGDFILDFQHSGALPEGTYVNFYVDTAKYPVGTAFDMYHVEENGSLRMTQTGLIVGEGGLVQAPIASCSSYVFEKNTVVSEYVELEGSKSSDSGSNIFIYVGIGVIAVAIIAAAVFFIRRN